MTYVITEHSSKQQFPFSSPLRDIRSREASENMKTENKLTLQKGTRKKASLSEIVKREEDPCGNCNPLTPIVCMTKCDTWKRKNELRQLYEKLKNQKFKIDLLNTLKNQRRLQILKMLSEGKYSVNRLQQELKKSGHYHSRKTITVEYVNPLVKAGLADEVQSQYYATTFGRKLDELMKNVNNFENILPPHSECHEEMALTMLLNEPKTFKELKSMIPTKSVARVLSRLQKAGLIETAKEKDYVFYFKTRRDSKKAKFSPTEKKIYENIPIEGVSARKLPENAKISLRRTYKYLRKLKGKKMVFARKSPKSYALTAKGAQVSITLQKIHNLTVETLEAATQLVKGKKTREIFMADTSPIKRRKKEKEVLPLTIVR
jgi:DNA-binding PadR family transcriptional regulator